MSLWGFGWEVSIAVYKCKTVPRARIGMATAEAYSEIKLKKGQRCFSSLSLSLKASRKLLCSLFSYYPLGILSLHLLSLEPSWNCKQTKSRSPGPLVLRKKKNVNYFLLPSLLLLSMLPGAETEVLFYQMSMSFEDLRVQIIAITSVVTRFKYLSLRRNDLYL